MWVSCKELFNNGEYAKVIDFLNPSKNPNQPIKDNLTLYYIWSLYYYYLESDRLKSLTEKEFNLITNEIKRNVSPSHMIMGRISDKKIEFNRLKGIAKSENPFSVDPELIKRKVASGQPFYIASTPRKYVPSERKKGLGNPYYTGGFDNENNVESYTEYENELPDRDYDDETAIEQGNIFDTENY